MNNFAAGFGDYLVPVLILLYVIFSVTKKFRAATTAPTVKDENTEVHDNTGSIKTLLEEMLLGEEFTAKQPTSNAAQTTTHEEKELAPEAFRSSSEPAPFLTYESNLYIGGERSEEKTITPKSEDELCVLEQNLSKFCYEDIDLRQAVILSEVLKRPYP